MAQRTGSVARPLERGANSSCRGGKGKGEIHRVVAIGASRPSAELVITRMISQLADLKLADHDPTTLQIRAVTWVNRSTALDDLGHIRRAKEPIANSDIPAAPDLVQ